MKQAIALTLTLGMAFNGVTGTMLLAQEASAPQDRQEPVSIGLTELRYNPEACPADILAQFNDTRGKLGTYNDNWPKADIMQMAAHGIDRFADYKTYENHFGSRAVKSKEEMEQGLFLFCQTLANYSRRMSSITEMLKPSDAAPAEPKSETPGAPEAAVPPVKDFLRFNVRACPANVQKLFDDATRTQYTAVDIGQEGHDSDALKNIDPKQLALIKEMGLRANMTSFAQAGLVFHASWLALEYAKENNIDLQKATPEQWGEVLNSFCIITGYDAQQLSAFQEESNRIISGKSKPNLVPPEKNMT